MKVFFARKNNKKTNIETVVPKEEFFLIRKCEKWAKQILKKSNKR
jgi:hypothetical protein